MVGDAEAVTKGLQKISLGDLKVIMVQRPRVAPLKSRGEALAYSNITQALHGLNWS